ncbi:hypothetical protein E4U17_006265 [Claviceps sp. LM77 group G4]|nr:hypothetical protein E4U17_006265 [Claviceps sp. LM77 group G4]KAG6063313.1 hypothetical protein E4U33_006376 [Claviceps sp. LM78 group G4]KAG6070989.1 hypothetical protein E4U16_006446 [Claviceps sp. LM84 group G4]
MASNPPPNRKRAQPSNTSLGGPRSRNPAQPRKSIGPSTAGVAKKRKSSSVGVASRLSTQSNNAKRGRPKGSTNRGVSSRRGTRGDDNDDDEAQEEYQDDDDDDDDDSSRTKKRGRTSSVTQRSSLGTSAVIGRRGIPQPNQPGSHAASDKPQQRPGPQDQDSNREASSAPPSPPKPYVHVAPYTRRVRQSAIEAKWSPLANASLTAVSTTLQHAQRPILQRISDSQLRREYTSSALRLITHRITRKISRGLPFPPASMPANVGRAPLQSDGGREVELNFESVLDGKVALERQLEPALDGLEVLRREKETLEEELERDYETLRTLEAGARAQAREQRSLLRRAHVLAPVAGNGNPDGDRDGETEGGEFELAREEDVARSGAFTEILQDDDIQPLAVQLGTHVDNIRANLEQTDDLMPQLTKSRAALRAVLLRHLDMRVYEQVVLG